MKLSYFWDNQDLFQDTRSKTYGVKKNTTKETKKETIPFFYTVLNINVWEGVGNAANRSEHVRSRHIVS